MATFNTRQFIDAMEKNGYRKANGTFVQYKEGTIEVYAACAVGQALLNLGVMPGYVLEAARKVPSAITDYVYGWNDDEKWPLKKIVKELKAWDIYQDEPIEFEIDDYTLGG